MSVSHSTQKSLVIAGGGPSQLPFIRETKERGFRTIVFDQNPKCQANGVADIFFPISTHDSRRIVDELKRYEDSLVSCFTYSSYSAAQATVATVNDFFGLIGLNSAALKCGADKSVFKSRLRDAGLTTPRSILTNDLTQAQHFIDKLAKVIVKPAIGGCGAAGVNLTTHQDHDLSKKLREASNISEDGSILIEEFIEGEEYSIDGVVDSEGVKNFLFSKKFSLGHEFGFAIDGFYSDSEIFSDFERQYSEKTKAAVAATGLTQSFFSLDVIVANDDVYFVDFGCMLDAKIDVLLEYAGASVYSVPAELALGNSIMVGLERIIEQPISLRLIYLKADDVASESSITRVAPGSANVVMFADPDSVNKPPQSVADAIGAWISAGDEARLAWSTPWAFDSLGDIN